MKIVAFVDDLMDRSRLGAVGGLSFAAEIGDARDADVVVVDLVRHADDIPAIREVSPAAHIVVFGPHVETAALDRAVEMGADVALPRSRFFADPNASVDPRDENPPSGE